MSAGNIQARIKRGLSKAVNKTGSANSEKVYLVREIKTGGDGTPNNPPITVPSNIELVDAIFTMYDKNTIDGTEVRAGDRKLVVNSDVIVNQGETIKQGSQKYYVVNISSIAPTSDVLVQILQVRQK